MNEFHGRQDARRTSSASSRRLPTISTKSWKCRWRTTGSTSWSPRVCPAPPTRRWTARSISASCSGLQHELVRLQDWVAVQEAQDAWCIFEGRDSAGKGGAIKRVTQRLNPRSCRVVALSAPTERERGQWYFQRYVPHLPTAGEMVLLDRSWYNRAGVERVMGFCTQG